MKKESKQYTFEDWLNNKFCDELGEDDSPLANDSQKYATLVRNGFMTESELVKIRRAQLDVYNYIIEKTLSTNERFLQRELRRSRFPHKVIPIKILQIDKYISDNHSVFEEVVIPKLFYPVGVRFILPEEYKDFTNKSYLDSYLQPHSKYRITLNGNLLIFPTPEQRRYLIMETNIAWQEKMKTIDINEIIKRTDPPPEENKHSTIGITDEVLRLVRETDPSDIQIMGFICDGKKYGQIGKYLKPNLSEQAVKQRVAKLREVTGTIETHEAINVFIKNGILIKPLQKTSKG